ncbi:ATPase domain-containing protein [Pelomonas sp. KK5]|uniref:RAD55 family ATPase n=1 Tax=Pelomonas sp. KK5 TaxID=1855730 RepID=UPI00097BED67|nr:ATPase domain-containing protein [Pelomonas sp. KK5]
MKRLPTAVPGLDQILHGGLFEGGVYIFEGPPGVGKTTLANQIAYQALAKDGTKTLYITLLAESHSRLVQHMQGQTFFRPEAVNSSVLYVSAYREFEEHGLKAIIDLVRGELSRHQASLFVIDGLVVENQEVGSNEGIRQFVHGLQSVASAMSCTGLLLTSGGNRALNAEQTMVDGIFAFEDYVYQWRTERRIQIRKFRGSAVERGKHTFCITDQGLQFFPRLEGLEWKAQDTELDRRLALGIEGLDSSVLLGGVAQGSSTVIVGDSGAGKTLLALSFAAQASPDEPCLLMTCADSPRDLVRIGQEFNLPISEAIDDGALEIRWEPQEDEGMDEIGHKLLRLVEESGSKRFVMDSLAGLADTVAFPERGYRFVGRLLRELKARGVTTLFTLDPAALQAAAGKAAADGLMAWFDNVLEISRTAQSDGARELNIKKIRGCRVTRARFQLELGASGLTAS